MAMNTIDYTKTQKGPSRIYTGIAIPAAGAEVTIGEDGVPDPTESPNCKQIGLTENGATCTITKTEQEEFFDEFKQSLARTVEQTGMMIKCKATQILDIDVLTVISSGVGTPQTITGKKKLKIGEAVITNTGIAVVAATRNDPTKFIVFHIYSGHNVANIDFPLSRQTRAGIDVEFHGVAVTSRSTDDILGAVWWDT
jgi:hypothetical protein